MRGLHLTAYAWRAQGELSKFDLEEEDEKFEIKPLDDLGLEHSESEPMAPKEINAVPRLTFDVTALENFFEQSSPTMVILRPVLNQYCIMYGFVDASGEGFGGTLRSAEQHLISARRGFWCSHLSEQSSNYREFRNLVEHVRDGAEKGHLNGKEVWIYTDNEVAEATFYRGGSKSALLSELVLQLRLVEIQFNFNLHVVHVAGTRMINEGTDGLSRGDLPINDLMTTLNAHVPLGVSAMQRSSSLLSWVGSWMDNPWRVAQPEDWFDAAHKVDLDERKRPCWSWIWDLAPAAAPDALEELAMARVKRHESLRGIVLVPKLMTPYWRRRFLKAVDFYFMIPAGCPCWPSFMHEPLYVGIFLPLLRFAPWDWRRVSFLVETGRTLSSLHKNDFEHGWDFLRKFWAATEWIEHMPKHVVCDVLSSTHDEETGQEMIDQGDELRYLVARPGDHLLCPFECDECVFIRLKKRVSREEPGDRFLLAYIRRANLDAFWARQPATVAAHRRMVLEQLRLGDAFGIQMFDMIGPIPANVDLGMRAAIGVLHKSNQPGRHEPLIKFSAARKIRSTHSNLFRVTPQALSHPGGARVEYRKHMLGINPTDSEWFTRFIKGFEFRVGQRVRRDLAISISVMLEFDRRAEYEWAMATTMSEKLQVAEWGAFFTFAFCHSLRGWEVVLATGHDLKGQMVTPTQSVISGVPAHIGLPLFGRFKNCGNSSTQILCFMVDRTASGLRPLDWAVRLLEARDSMGWRSDWLFQNEDGSRKRMNTFEELLGDYLLGVQQNQPHLIPNSIDVTEAFGLARSFRRGATTRAQNAGVSEADINWVNRWGTAGDLIVRGPMRAVYSERTQMLHTLLRFSRAL